MKKLNFKKTQKRHKVIAGTVLNAIVPADEKAYDGRNFNSRFYIDEWGLMIQRPLVIGHVPKDYKIT